MLTASNYQPLEKSFLERVSRIQLQTTAHDQGYASFPDQGSWSWFDVAILESPESTAPLVRDGLTCLWRSHCNVIGFGQDTTTAGEIFDMEDDLFKVLQVSITTFEDDASTHLY